MKPRASKPVVVSADPSLFERIDEAFAADPALVPVARLATLDDLRAALAAGPPGIVLVDIDPDPADTLAELSDIVDRHPLHRFVILAPEFDRDLIVLSMQSGARHFMPKPWIDEGMAPICHELHEQIEQRLAELTLPGDTPAGGTGPIFGVLSTGGGCGATTLAVGLADACAELRNRETDGPTLLVDLDVRFGGAATHLNLTGDYSIAELLERDGPLDVELIRSASVNHKERFGVLISPATVNFEDPPPVRIDRLGEIIDAMSAANGATVIDAPSFNPVSAAALADVSTLTLVSTTLSIKDIRSARLLLATLRAEAPNSNVAVAVRVPRKRGPVSVKDATEALEHEGPVFEIPEDPAAEQALTAGVTLREAAPKSRLCKAIDDMARSVIAPEPAGSKRKRRRNAA